MRYVKQKLVKKIKTEQMPVQVADKYLDIYKELIEKEAERKAEEAQLMKQYGMTNSLSIVRKKAHTRSEQKARTGKA